MTATEVEPVTVVTERLSPRRGAWSIVAAGRPASAECWEAEGPLDRDGYWRFGLNGQHTYAHRLSYELHVGPIPQDLAIDHLCRNRACWNPAHLEPVTVQTNGLRGVGHAAVNAAKTACKRGHAFTPENTYERNGRRHCRPCRAAAAREARKR